MDGNGLHQVGLLSSHKFDRNYENCFENINNKIIIIIIIILHTDSNDKVPNASSSFQRGKESLQTRVAVFVGTFNLHYKQGS
jgi:hypothetical protein